MSYCVIACQSSSCYCFCTLYQIATIPQKLEFNYYYELHKNLEEITIGNRIEKQRLLKNMKQSELAITIGASRGAIEDYESSSAYPSPVVIKRIAEILNKPLHYFYDDYYKFVFSDFPKIIQKWRQDNKLSLCDAGKIIGIDYRSIRNWENGNIMDRVYFSKIKPFLHL